MSANKRIKILLVDDSAAFAHGARLFIEAVFEGDNRLEVLDHVASASEALHRIEAHRPDLVLMDLHMPGMNGIEATRRIKSAQDGPSVVMLSLCEDDVLQQAAERAGADGYLNKSSLAKQLPPLIRALLDKEAP